ncbi:LPS assembly lipoprotein LptE [Kangiella sp. HZ709]|uniref:LPS-assembly lipoprotein LptE n=1 Tax=Kangiella sp. HZ709 TaxID=2666328 RepID=UPI0012B021FF|nr:hypothetical protein [Kangiella sp. HZ709]
MINKSFKLLFIAIVAVSILNACGFQLRGQGFDLNDTKVWLQTNNPNSDFERSLKQRLLTQGGSWVIALDSADLQLGIEQYSTEERVLARDASGRPSELELIFKLDYRLAVQGKDYGKGLAPLQHLSSRREMAYDRNLETGQAVEKDRLLKDMQQAVISRLLLQMAKSQ